MPDAEVAIFAKAPVPGYAKTRLIPRLGPDGAAAFGARLIEHTVATAVSAGIGPVTLWCAPDAGHPLFQALGRRGLSLAIQPLGDLGSRMLAAFQATAGPLVLIGTDCPVLRIGDLQSAASALAAGADAVIGPAEDGGYGLIAARRPLPCLFRDIPWSTGQVAAATRARAVANGVKLVELPAIWDVDAPADWERLALLAPALARGPGYAGTS
jgi:uncharacterized protein